MKSDTLSQFLALRKGLLAEKATLEARLREISSVLNEVGPVIAAPAAVAAAPVVRAARKARGPAAGRGGNEKSLKTIIIEVLTKKKKLARKDLLDEVKAAGYKFTASDPMNSMSTLVYTNRKLFKAEGGIISLL
jgi:hypothetical protein